MRRLFLPLLLCLSFQIISALEMVEDKRTIPILTPDIAKRTTAKIRLDNGLEAYLISDPATLEGGAALTVMAGSWDEPVDRPGLAHFLEHMLFLGTKKYPNESEYNAYLAAHGGQSNAFTYNDITAYMFSVKNEGFVGALDRFANFFIEPLFNPSGVSREINAIEQEYRKNAENDDFLMSQILRQLADKDHPFHGFSSGNKESLKDATQEELKKWYKEHYSADKMRLWLYSSLSIEEMKKLVESDFGPIGNHEGEEAKNPKFLENMFSEQAQGKVVYMEPIQDKTTLALVWELPSDFSKWKEERPWNTVSWILGEEGSTSLAAQLKREGLADNVSVGALKMTSSKILFFLDVDLTEEGLKNREHVVERIFQAIARLKEKGVSKELFDAIRAQDLIKYQWTAPKGVFEDAMAEAFVQSYEPLETYPELSNVSKTYDKEKIDEVIEALSPGKAIYFLMAPSSKTDMTYELRDPWTKTPYTIKTFDFEKYKTVLPINEIQMPAPNPFIPSSFELKNKNAVTPWEKIKAPDLLVDEARGKLYYQEDLYFGTPTIYASFEVRTPVISNAIPQSLVFRDLLQKGIEDTLTDVISEASLAGLSLTIVEGDEGLRFILSGFSDKAPLILEKLISALSLPDFKEERFDILLAQLKKDYRNFQLESPIRQATELFNEAIYKNYPTNKQKDLAAKNVTFEKFKKFLTNVWRQNYTEAVILGNVSKVEASSMWNQWTNSLGKIPYPLEKQKTEKPIILPLKGGPYKVQQNIRTKGNALLLALEDPDFSHKRKGALQVLDQAMDTDFFAELRTRQQTGYLVGVRAEDMERKLFEFFIVQSSTHTAEELLWRVETFIQQFLQELKQNFPEAQFAQVKAALIAKMGEKPKSLRSLGELLVTVAYEYKGDFEWVEKRISTLQSLTYDEFLSYADQMLGRNNKRRLAILVEGPAQTPYKFKPFRVKK